MTGEVLEQLKMQGFSNYPDPVLFGGPDRTVVLANEAAANFFGYATPESMVGVKVSSMVPPELMSEQEHDSFYDSFLHGQRIRRIGQESPLFAQLLHGGQVPVGLKLFSVTVGDQVFVGEIVRDRTKEVDQEKRIRTQTVELEQASRELKTSNQKLEQNNAHLDFQLKRQQSQDKIIFWLLIALAGLYLTPMALSLFIRVPAEMQSLSRDAIIFLLGIVSSAVSGALGIQKTEREAMPTPKPATNAKANAEK
jgi:PAS domain S-box-containing protein